MPIARPQWSPVRTPRARVVHALSMPLAATGRAACGKRSKRWLVPPVKDARLTCMDCKRAVGKRCGSPKR